MIVRATERNVAVGIADRRMVRVLSAPPPTEPSTGSQRPQGFPREIQLPETLFLGSSLKISGLLPCRDRPASAWRRSSPAAESPGTSPRTLLMMTARSRQDGGGRGRPKGAVRHAPSPYPRGPRPGRHDLPLPRARPPVPPGRNGPPAAVSLLDLLLDRLAQIRDKVWVETRRRRLWPRSGRRSGRHRIEPRPDGAR